MKRIADAMEMISSARETEQLRGAIEAGDLEAVKRLIGSDSSLLHAILIPGPNRNYRPLTLAAVVCQLSILEYLIGEGCDVCEDHHYPMFRAALYDDCVPALAMLVACGADVNSVWDDYGPALIATCEGAAIECMQWLVDHGARIAGSGPGSTRNVEWDAVVHAAFRHKNRPDLLTFLLDRGGPVNGREKGRTPLHVLAARGDVVGVRLLLNRGADRSLKDNAGRRPIDVTRNRQVRELLDDGR